MKLIYSSIFLCWSVLLYAQPLSNGMGIITHWSGGAGQFNSFSVFDTQNNASAPLGTNWETNFYTPNPAIEESWKGTFMGNVFGIAIDAQKNVYFAANRSLDVSLSLSQSGVAGDGGVYKMDANSWEVTPFIFTGSGNNQIPNVANGLGNIAYDKWNNQLFITNFEDGKIYRYDMQGNFLSSFDPFNPDNSELGMFSGVGEALWGINLNNENGVVKVYFSQWNESDAQSDGSNPNNAVWSVNLDNNGDFTGDELFCFALEDNLGVITSEVDGASYPISDIIFSSDGKMYLSEKGVGGAGFFPFNGLATNIYSPSPHRSRTFEYVKENNAWVLSKQYCVGNYNSFPGLGSNLPTADNSAGGVALGNRQTDSGFECESILFTSGDALRFPGYNLVDGSDFLYGVAGVPVDGNSLDFDSDIYFQTSSIYINVAFGGDQFTGTGKNNYGDVEIYLDEISNNNLSIIPSTTICNGESIQLNVSGGSNYEWSPALTLDDSNSANPIATPTENTTYTVTGEGGDCGGGGTASVTINIDDFNFSLGPDIVNCVTAEGQTLDAGEEAQSYLWNTGETTQTINATTTGDYTVNVVSPAGCDYSDEISLINSQAPTLAFSTPDNGSCPPATFTLNDESIPIESDPIVAWSWQVDGNNYNNSTTSIGLQNSGNYAVTLEVTTELGCIETLTIDDYLNVFSSPTAEFITESAELSKCDKTIELINLSTDYDSLSWNFGDGITINEDTVSTYTYSEVSDYTITLTTVNSLGCEKTFYKQIIPETSIPFFAPNAFTPDEDDLNEVFMPILGCHDNFEFWVFNRWGENVFYSNDINVGWDGIYKDQLSPIGIYSWKARYDGTKVNQVKFGEVHLMH
jgi:gliding motility-associated-like protein